MWHVDYELIEDWLDNQDTDTVAHVFAALELLEVEGPNLKRPLVGNIRGRLFTRIKELRPASPGNSEIRILFAFDPRRCAVLLLAGDKSVARSRKDKWSGWYRKAVPEAERRFAEHLQKLKEEDRGKSR